jgi:hypothetical protein
MPKTRIGDGLEALVYLKLMEVKNQLKFTFAHPLGAVETVFKVLLPIITLVVFPLIFNHNGLKGGFSSFHPPVNMIGAVIMLLLTVILFINLKKAVDDYYPTQYQPADVNLLFTSPISSRLIYAWSMIRQMAGALMGILIMALPLVFLARIFPMGASAGEISCALAGLALFIMIVQTLKFFLYSLSKGFGIGALVKTLVYVSFGAVVIYFTISLFERGDFLQGAIEMMGSPTISRIPVVGWTQSLLHCPFVHSTPVSSLMMLILFATLMLFVTIYLATDYYEEAISSTEKMAKVRAAYAGNNMEAVHHLISKKQVKLKQARHHWDFGEVVFNNAGAFLWKAAIINRRKSKGALAEAGKYVYYAVIGGIFGYVFRNHTYQELMIPVMFLGGLMRKGNTSLLEGLEYELKKNYLFLLPGRARDKILAINLIPLLKTLARNLVIVFSMALFLKVNGIQLVTFWVVLGAINLVSLFTAVALKAFFPFQGRNNIFMVYLGFLIEILLQLPAVGVGGLTYLLFKNIEAALFISGIGSLLTVMGLLRWSEVLFGRLELNN